MKAQLLGVAVSLWVHAIFVVILWNMGQGFSPGTGTIALDLSLEASGPMGYAAPREENALPSHELSTTDGAPNEPQKIPSIPEKDRPDSSKAEPPPISPKQQPLERPQPQPVQPDPPTEPQSPEPEKPKPVPPPPLLASDGPIPERRKEPTGPASAISSDDKENVPTDQNSSPGSGLAGPAPGPLNPLHKTVADQAGPEGDGLSGPGGESDASSTMNNKGGDAYLNAHLGSIRRRLRKTLCYPSIARQRGWSGKVLIAFTIHPDGIVDQIEVKKSCGISLLDKSALATVRNASPLPQPPMAVRIIIPILYQLN